MRKRLSRAKVSCVAVAVAAFASIGFAPGASAFSGEFAVFNQCPTTTPGAFKCINAVTNGGKVKLGKKSVPIVNPVRIQGAVSQENEEFISTFFGAKNGETLSKTPQPVPGGLAGLVNCPEIKDFFLRIACEATFENGLTGVNSTLELARPATEIRVSQVGLASEEGLAMKLPVKVHLENPFLGSGCFIGSSGTPIIWNLTTGETTPPAGFTPLHGTSGTGSFKGEFEIFHLSGTRLVENNWSAPGASGCGGFLVELLLNPIINASVGVPSAKGVNEADLQKNEIDVATVVSVNKHP